MNGREHFRAESSKRQGYQWTNDCGGKRDWTRFQLRDLSRLGPVAACRAETCSRRLEISVRMLSTSLVDCIGVATVETEGTATSIIVSVSVANSRKVVFSLAEAKTIRTLLGNQCINSCLKNDLSMVISFSPRSCCIQWSNCGGFQSPSSSAVNNCSNRRCSDAKVRSVDIFLKVSYGWVFGGFSQRSLTLVEISGEREPTTQHGFLCCDVSRSELRFDLYKPDLWIACPIRRDLHSIGLHTSRSWLSTACS